MSKLLIAVIIGGLFGALVGEIELLHADTLSRADLVIDRDYFPPQP